MKTLNGKNNDNHLRINVDEIASYKNFINNPELIKNKILAIVKNDELMFYAVSPALMKNLSATEVSVNENDPPVIAKSFIRI